MESGSPIEHTLTEVTFPVKVAYFVLLSLAKHRVITANPLMFSPTVRPASDGFVPY